MVRCVERRWFQDGAWNHKEQNEKEARESKRDEVEKKNEPRDQFEWDNFVSGIDRCLSELLPNCFFQYTYIQYLLQLSASLFLQIFVPFYNVHQR